MDVDHQAMVREELLKLLQKESRLDSAIARIFEILSEEKILLTPNAEIPSLDGLFRERLELWLRNFLLRPEQALLEMPGVLIAAPRQKRPARIPAAQKLLDAATAIQAEPDAVERAYMTRQLILCTLPHSDPLSPSSKKKLTAPVWHRKAGNTTLVIQPGWNTEEDKSFGYPYGTIPRLLLFWICAQVQKTKNDPALTPIEKRTLSLGKNLHTFMHRVGLNPDTGNGLRGDKARLRDQMERLFYSNILFTQTKAFNNMKGRIDLNMTVAPEKELWWSTKQHTEQETLWHSWIRLGETFYNQLLAMPVPLDYRALRALKKSPLALDLYAWVCYQAFKIVQKQQEPQFVAWQDLQLQLGTDYDDVADLKKKARKALRKVQTVYPGLTIGQAEGGFTIHATRLAVPSAQKELPQDI